MTFHLHLLRFSLLILCFASCQESRLEKNVSRLKPGYYELLFDISEIQIPVRLCVNADHTWNIQNWDETINLDSLQFSNSTFHVKMPLFQTTLDGLVLSDSTLSGTWTDNTRDSLYQIPFTGRFIRSLSSNSFSFSAVEKNKRVYDVTFSPDIEEDKSDAVGIFYTDSANVVGTFLTESGDYRYLQGVNKNHHWKLSSFDGAHLFCFVADLEDNQLLNGKFYSGKHWSENWNGYENPMSSLRNPDSLTFIEDKKEPFRFTVLNLNGDSIHFDQNKFRGHVTVVQIFGSWCPNCTDESKLMKELYASHSGQGLEIIPVAFERSSSFNQAKTGVLKQFTELGLTYPPYFGGSANKGNASQIFSALSPISSYPTAIFIDKKGEIRKIHTGFYGPGTGEHYAKHKQEISDFVASLIAENP